MTRYLSLAEYLWLAEQVTGLDAGVLAKAARLDLADSALHAPGAGFAGEDFYPDLLDKAAVVTCRLAWNHPLPDGNKRAAWGALVLFLDLNNVTWEPDPPDVDQAEVAMHAVAAHEVDETWLPTGYEPASGSHSQPHGGLQSVAYARATASASIQRNARGLQRAGDRSTR